MKITYVERTKKQERNDKIFIGILLGLLLFVTTFLNIVIMGGF